MTTTETTIPNLTTIDDARTTLEDLAGCHEWVSVFWDRGWGDSGQTADITVIVNGDGQKPLAHITADVYRALLDQQIIAPNSLQTYKARKLHDYKTPPKEERSGPNPADVAEQMIRRIMTDHPDWPIVARFYRGLERGPYGPVVAQDEVQTPAADDGWFVLLHPGCADAAISAQEPTFLGPDIIGRGVADCIRYPQADGDVDVEALTGDEFRARLVAAIEEKLALIEAMRAKV